jgi:hypothetical protein
MKLPPQLILGTLEHRTALPAEMFSGAIDVEHEHRHRRPEGIRLAPLTSLGGSLEGTCNRSGILPSKHAVLEIERIARLCHTLGPPRRFGRAPFFRSCRGTPMCRRHAILLVGVRASGLGNLGNGIAGGFEIFVARNIADRDDADQALVAVDDGQPAHFDVAHVLRDIV